jgi:uncharacterized protein
MDDRVYLTSLYDIYEGLLTEKQKAYFEDYYFNNLSLQEICDLYDISRNAIHKQIKDVENKLYNYEDKLNIYDNNIKIKELIKDIDKGIKEQIEELL